MPRNLTDEEITKLLTDWESEEELLEDVVGSVDCDSGLINKDNSDQFHIVIPFSIIDESDNSDFVHISNEMYKSVIKNINLLCAPCYSSLNY